MKIDVEVIRFKLIGFKNKTFREKSNLSHIFDYTKLLRLDGKYKRGL